MTGDTLFMMSLTAAVFGVFFIQCAVVAARCRCAVCRRPCPLSPPDAEGRRVCPDCRRRVNLGCAPAGRGPKTKLEV